MSSTFINGARLAWLVFRRRYSAGILVSPHITPARLALAITLRISTLLVVAALILVLGWTSADPEVFSPLWAILPTAAVLVVAALLVYTAQYRLRLEGVTAKRGVADYMHDYFFARPRAERVVALGIASAVPAAAAGVAWGLLRIDSGTIYQAAAVVYPLVALMVMFERQGDLAPNADGTDLYVAPPRR